ncbi:sulfotransferase family 2 domain-containing protein [Pseudooceanicola marinus]|uniref:sulfotransferase family 2 domain-containing protein n=1 Tax=Pseudooceanicola marinus TaxID=396013 RepID=UPI001CD61309|nr:sulfotransferase family 2 domain-containing protein [Pseudooceanicola marinus]MCA1338173.1 sulfotransferase family protein [Pseudooceanicola marinus]
MALKNPNAFAIKQKLYRLIHGSPLQSGFARLYRSGSPFKPEVLRSRAIFIHIPKASGSSVKTELYGQPKYGHRALLEFDVYDPVQTRDFFKFTFVRNPWDRFLSAFSYLHQGKGTSRPDEAFADLYLRDLKDFTAFVDKMSEDGKYRRKVMSYVHFVPQADWICLPGEARPAMDFIGRTEHFADDMARVREALGLPAQTADISHVRASRHLPYSEAYTPDARDFVATLYRRDIDMLGYDF